MLYAVLWTTSRRSKLNECRKCLVPLIGEIYLAYSHNCYAGHALCFDCIMESCVDPEDKWFITVDNWLGNGLIFNAHIADTFTRLGWTVFPASPQKL